MEIVTQDVGGGGVESADWKTLRLSTPRLEAALLERYLAYQRAYVELLEQSVARTSELMAQAHTRALAASGLSAEEVGRVAALCTDYAGRRSVEQTLQAKQVGLAERLGSLRAGGGHPSAKELELEQRLADGLRPPGAAERLAARHGEAAISVLRAREPELLELHRRQLQVLL
ncbi:MAG: hypothetical protein FJ086_05770 [Deltaproteobacteria bacterium]|nr:hypothetical protein [Deltaproteobacteria bacterium]